MCFTNSTLSTFSQHSVNIQSTFGEHSVNIQRKMRCSLPSPSLPRFSSMCFTNSTL
jgi:hypothetical protein